ncbi:MAG TPA: regulatory protein RecX [Thermoleophilaceae bacterium]|jgi:regulatory protein|nr:regulatory protein RecX [Thermoleophilaceae bacterium]
MDHELGPAPDGEVEGVSQREHERAIELAYRAVGYRERTVAELRTFLERKRVGPCAIDEAVAELSEAGFLDDERYALRFADDKRELERWGSERIARDLQRRGVAPDLIEAAIAARSGESELSAALLVLKERLPPPGDDRERDRAWRLLVRRGYATELAYEAVRRYEREADDGRRAA